MAMTRAQFQRGLFPGIRDLIFRSFREFPLEYVQLFNVMTSDKAFEEDHTIAGAGLFVRTPEDVEVAQDEFLPGFPKRYQADDYTLAIGASLQLRRDDKWGFWKERAADLGYSARQTMEVLHADFIAGGFTTSLTPDGVTLFNAAHPNIKVGTQNNILNPVGTLSVLSVRTALTQFRRFFDDTGVRRRQLMPANLIVPPEEEYNAEEIIKSAGRPDTANRADNVVRNALDVFVWDYLPDPNDWFVSCEKGQHKVKSFNRTAFGVREYMDEPTETQFVSGRMAFSYGASHWIGWLGANPS